jgi:hypothetical protein
MNPQIPQSDPLGLPAPPAMLIALMVLTLVLHWAFVGAAVGAALTVMWSRLRDTSGAAAMRLALLTYLPFTVSMGVTLGIAPLLLVQVLYGNFFYTAAILHAAWWLLMLPVLVTVVYLAYWAKVRQSRGSATPLPAAIALTAGLLYVGCVISASAVLSQSPGAWADVWRWAGAGVFTGSHALPRICFALAGLCSWGLLAVAMAGRWGAITDRAGAQAAMRTGTWGALAASVVQLAAGAWLLASLEGHLRSALWSGGVGRVAVSAACAAVILAPVLALLAAFRPTGRTLACAAAVSIVGMAALATARDALRQAAIWPHMRLSDLPVNPQWGAFALFAAALAAAVAAVWYMLRLARAGQQRCSPEPADVTGSDRRAGD